MGNREIYASDESYKLCKVSEEDKENYIKLLKETTFMPKFYDNQMYCDIMWKGAMEGNTREFSIFDKNENYCGNIVIKYSWTEHPEIGIDIVGRYRNQGIAPKAIKMLARKAYEEHPVPYYFLRVSSQNLHSKHVIEKLGGVLDDTTEDLFLKHIRNVFGEEKYKEMIEWAKEQADDEVIYQYRYLPEFFLK
ncbi:MAG: GNAT family N-acetyltransferase [Eubacteriales bacterium]|nr:GNAT family N-acetyltransferase [Eubacteriales bacterium]